MNNIQILDCTLRDGGYCNQWMFGQQNMRKITDSLLAAKIDIVECGFLSNRVSYQPDCSRFPTMEAAHEVLPEHAPQATYVVMINFGEYEAGDLPECDGKGITGIRVAFHKKHFKEAMAFCKDIQEKGYRVFVQPMVSLTYSDEEFTELIRMANELQPYAFYIVDSFGMMKRTDLLRLFHVVEKDLEPAIRIGFHSHNNLQLAYANAQSLVDLPTERALIIDSSIYGMGRGAGNLNTELFIDYLNDVRGTSYDLKPLLHVIDEVLNRFYQENYWGYSLPNYLSATHNIHPNYASYLSELNTLTVEAMDEIFARMDPEKAVEFDKGYMKQLYMEYMALGEAMEQRLEEFSRKIAGRRVLLIGPGKNAVLQKERILSVLDAKDVVSISVNFDYPYATTDFIFVSNLRRFRDLAKECQSRVVITSNIKTRDAYMSVDYQTLLNDVENAQDNAGMMAMKLLISLGVQDILMAGFDGYSHDTKENYGLRRMSFVSGEEKLDAMNRGVKTVLQEYAKQVRIHWVTDSLFDDSLK